MPLTAYELENRKSPLVANDCLAVDHARSPRQLGNRQGDEGKAARQVIAVARNQPHAACVQARHNTKAVVLDFVDPARPGWRSLGRGGQAVSLIAPRPRRAMRSRNKTIAPI